MCIFCICFSKCGRAVADLPNEECGLGKEGRQVRGL